MNDWQQVQTLFEAAVEMSPVERAEFLRTRCEDEPTLLASVQRLLAADTESEAVLRAAVEDGAADLFDTQQLVGQRLGMYRILREIGRGGMGSVYLAVRDDAEFEKRVAVKVVRRGMDTADVLKRFRHERQILANLEHPYIARLLDGGSTPQGGPFFVMEFIEGQRVDEFCLQSELDYDAICKLFLLILEAVAYAHRGLVVHRDLKPANILITAEGKPKLLDFGVARLITGDATDGNHTATAMLQAYTPEYASPEQVRGERITTATDIYSLGAVLYELVSGWKAQPIKAVTPVELERVVCRVEPLRPRLLAPRMSPDLGNIVMMALRKDPERRYQSAGQFADDLRRYLEGRPVIARPDSFGYRARKFVARNRLQMFAASVVAASLLAAVGISMTQAHRADAARDAAEAQRIIAVNERSRAEAATLEQSKQKSIADTQRTQAEQQAQVAEEQRAEAQQQKGLADQRVQDILDLANRSLFDVHDAIAPLPGSLEARQAIVKTTLDYLQSLEAKNGLDDSMRLVLSGAYFKVAMIQGDSGGASLQDFAGSERNLLKAQSLLQPLYERRPNDQALMRRWLEINFALGDMVYISGRKDEGIQQHLALLPIAEKLTRTTPCPVSCQTQEADIENILAFEYQSVDAKKALQHIDRGIVLIKAVTARNPQELKPKMTLASLEAAGGGAYKGLIELEKAAEYYKLSIVEREGILRAEPGNIQIKRNLTVVYGNYATLLGVPWSPNLGRPEEARLYAAKAVAIARETAAADPKDATAKHDLGMSLGRLGMIDPAEGQAAASLAVLQEARKLIEPLVAANPGAPEASAQTALIMEYEAHRLEEMGRLDEARATLERSLAILKPFVAKQQHTCTVEFIADQRALALLDARGGRFAEAKSAAERAMATVEEHYASATPEARSGAVGDALATRALVEQQAGEHVQALVSARSSLEWFGKIQRTGVLSAHRKEIEAMRRIAAGTSL